MQREKLLERNGRKDTDEEIAKGMAGDTVLGRDDPHRVGDSSEGLQLWVTHVRAGALLRDFSL